MTTLDADEITPDRALLRGTRVRASNAMARTRAKLLDAAGRLVAQRATRKTSMQDIAVTAGIAKGTLYNHFRSKEEVFAALVEAEVLLLADEVRDLPLEQALVHAAWRIGTHPALRRVAADEPAVLAGLLASSRYGDGWRAARLAAAEILAGHGRDPDAADLVVRWLASHVAAPERLAAEDTARMLAAVIPAAPPSELAGGGLPD